MSQVTLRIEGMSCSHCIQAVRQALSSVPGAEVQDVKLGEAKVMIHDSATPVELERAVVRAGYEAQAV